ncbi:Aerobic-type carbon monoxide dehydrogenase, large subunit CoxL/CutL-like protein [Candidatus Sulfopaludibacter sp. SbA4]|nr:Aerobic-type carbon monoxide dehydrogenase, large subunit CoxL/CutL-like protein [Candidatus Sulfopaludibacter sp. SbA4]
MHAMTSLTRRGLLKSGGALMVSFALGAALPKRTIAQSAAAPDVDSFLAIHADGSVTIYTSKVDIGTGLATAFRQTAAEELGIPVERFNVIEGDTATTPNHGGTGGSSGIPRGAADIRRAAATARQALLDLGSKQLNRPAADLTISAGEVHPAADGKGIAVAALIGGKRFSLKVDPQAPLRDPAAYTVVGKPILRADVPAKCTGRHPYLQDLTVPGMLHGRVVRPASMGARLLSVDESSVRAIPGVRVVRVESFLGVVAKDEWAAIRAARELKATWSEWSGLPGSAGFERTLRESPVERDQVVVNRGDANAPKPLSATYYWPFQSHASLAPSCAVADCKESGTTVWSASQNPFGLRGNLAKVFGIPQEKIHVIYLDGSGSYGSNGNDDAAADALLLSRAAGQPVRMQWMREDEHGWDPKGPAQLLDIRGAIDAEGNITAWETQMWLPGGPQGDRALVGPESAGLAQGHGQNAGAMTLNTDPPYATANLRVVAHSLKDTPLRLSNLRAPGKIANVFAVEGFTDELAVAAGMDAAAFRRRLLADPRAIAVLDRALAMIEWQPRPSPNPKPAAGNLHVGRGIAYMRYKHTENYVAMAMEVAVDRATGKVTVRRVACAHDCGLIVNPDGLRNQVEGNIVQTLSRTLHEEVTFDRSRVTSVDWASYPVLTFPEAPAIEVALIDHPDQPSYGAGEAASAPVAAALANAIFDATGVRLRTVPFTPARVKAALA